MSAKRMLMHYLFAGVLVAMLFTLVILGKVQPGPFQDMILAALTGLGVYHSSSQKYSASPKVERAGGSPRGAGEVKHPEVVPQQTGEGGDS